MQILLKLCGLIVLVILVTSCANHPKKQKLDLPFFPEPLRKPIAAEPLSNAPNLEGTPEPQTRFSYAPGSPARPSIVPLASDDYTPAFEKNNPISINLENLPLPAFINEVFGNLLSIPFQIDQQVQNKQDLVTLRITQPQEPKQLYHTTRQVLQNYGVGIQAQGDLLRFVIANPQQKDIPSMIIDGLALPEVPPSHRPIFQFIPLTAVHHTQITGWIRKAYEGQQSLRIEEDSFRNAIILMGPPDVVTQAAKAVRTLDHPIMRGRYSLRIEPAFLPPSELTSLLQNILGNEGYSVSQNMVQSSTIFMPIDRHNILLVFANSQAVLDHIQAWVKQLDKLNKEDKDMGLFIYPVKNTPAPSLGNLLNSLLARVVSSAKRNAASFVVDTDRNSLIFLGNNEQWARILPILKSMDQPAKQVLIEATVAEITLSDEDKRGIEWVINSANLGGLDGVVSTKKGQGGSQGLGIAGDGLTYTLSNAGDVRAVLNLFASNNRTTILSTPRLIVRSGKQATIEVATEIPTLTSQINTPELAAGGTTGITQQIQYRKTGTLLNIQPTIYAGRRVDLIISQEVSESRPNTTSDIDSPAVFNRRISTELTLQDGHSVLLGGLISNSQTEGTTGVPILSDIPLLGQLFRVDKKESTRTELVILLIPYVIDNDQEAQAITQTIQERLNLLMSDELNEGKLPLDVINDSKEVNNTDR